MRRDTSATGISVPRLCRMSATALLVVLAFLLSGAASAPGAARAAFTAPSAAKSASAAPSAKCGGDGNEEKTKREAERGQPRRTARTSVGVPQHTGRPLPPFSAGAVSPAAAPAAGKPAAGSSTKAASRPAALSVLHCVFRC